MYRALHEELSRAAEAVLVMALRAEHEALDRRITELGDVDALYHAALEEKGRMLVERGDEHGQLVLSLAEQHSEACAILREIREAIDCGEVLSLHLADAARALDEAKSWEYGGSMARRAKGGWLDEATRHINAAQVAFERFRKELSEIEGMELADSDEDTSNKSWLDGLRPPVGMESPSRHRTAPRWLRCSSVT